MAEKIKRKRTPLFVQIRFLILSVLWLCFVGWSFWYEPIHIDLPFGRNIELISSSILSFLWLPFAIRHIRKFDISREALLYFLALTTMSIAAIMIANILTVDSGGPWPCGPMYEFIGNTIFSVRTGHYFCW